MDLSNNSLFFHTDTGTRVAAISADQMRLVDKIATEETGPNLYQMMENAGRNLASIVMSRLDDDWGSKRILVLAGSGGNGGGGICTARHLANRNAHVTLCLVDPEKLGEVPRWQRNVYRSTTGNEIGVDLLHSFQPDLIIDALFGYSLKGPPTEKWARVIEWANSSSASIISLDIPSGVDATTGETPDVAIEADVTVTLALPKTGLISTHVGEVFLADIGIPHKVYQRLGIEYSTPFDHRFLVPLHRERFSSSIH